MKKIAFFCIAALVFIAFASCGRQSDADAVRAYYRTAEQQLADGDYDAARKTIDEAVSIYGNGALLDSLLRKMEPETETQTAAVAQGKDAYDDVVVQEFISEFETYRFDEETEITVPSTKKTEKETTTIKNETTTTKIEMTTIVTTTKRIEQTQTTTAVITLPAVTQKSTKEIALDAAKAYLEQTANSRSQTIDQLKKSGLSASEAVYAVDHCGANWNDQAVKAAKKYVADGNASGYGYSHSSLKSTLMQAGFSESEAGYAIDRAGVDWNTQAKYTAQKQTSGKDGYSRKSLKTLLQNNGYSESEASYAVDRAGIDWNAQAVLSAKAKLNGDPNMTDDALFVRLTNDGFTADQARYAIAHCR